jgi:exonuclease SbcC
MKPEILVVKNVGPFQGTHRIDFTGLGDMFLVYGKTGAGKTTLFDAIAYALYGEAQGERKGLVKEMRSHFSAPGDESAVSLSFSLSGKRWRVARTLPFERLGARSGKVQTVAEEVTLEEWTDSRWKDVSSTNKSETDLRIVALIGLSSEEFSRIVILPQGEFARFLRLNSNERKTVLSKLFPVERYARVTERARERARDAAALLRDTEQEILSLQQRFNRLSYDGDRETLALEVNALKEGRDALRSRIGERGATLEKARAAGKKRARERELARRLSELEEGATRIEGLRVKVALANRAAPLAVRLKAVENAEIKLSANASELTRLAASLSAERERLSALESDNDRTRELEAEKTGLIGARERLRAAVTVSGELERDTAEHDSLRKRLAAATARKETIATEIGALAKRRAELETDRAGLDARNDAASLAREALETARRIKSLAEEFETERRARAAHAGAIALVDEELANAKRDAEIAKAELADVERAAEESTNANAAAKLAATLETGRPCPVCGSVDHPSPARIPEAARFSHAERIDSGRRRIESLAAKAVNLEKTRAAREADLAGCDARLGRFAERLASLRGENDEKAIAGTPENATLSTGASMPSVEESSEAVRLAAKAAQETQDALSRSRSAWREAEDIGRRQDALKEESDGVARESLELERLAAGKKAEIAQKKSRLREALPDGVESKDPQDALERCEARLLEIEQEINARADRIKESRDRSSALSGMIEALDKATSALSASLKDDSLSLDRDLSAAGFSDRAAARAAAIGEEERREMERAVAEADAALAETRGLLADARSELAGWTGPDEETVAADLERDKTELEAADAELEKATAGLTALDALKERHDALEAERLSRSVEAGRCLALANDLTGNNPLKTAFDAWVLAMYLEEVTAYANERLVRMSEGRYRIRLNDSYRKGNAYAGLELEILDAYTGKARPSATLSGGETFMASISLALGLADSIQSRAGGVQLDAVFIDEGFGSLDESSLERAITILDEIRGSRMVGIISHVSELRGRVPNRIEVVKTAAGSSVRAEINAQGEI